MRPSAVALPELGLGVGGEERERRRGRPLLPHEQHRGERPGERQQGGAGELVVVEVLGEPVAAGAVADLVVVLVGHHEPPGRHVLGVDGRAVVALAERRERPVVEEPLLAHLGQRLERLEVGVVAGGLAAQRDVDGVVEVVAPLRVEAVATGLARAHEERVVEVGLGDQGERAAQVRRQRGGLDRHLLEEVDLRGVLQRVHGVEPQGVDVVVLEPHPDVVEDVAAHLRRVLAVEVDQVAPRVAPGLQVGAEQREVVARGAEVVVHHVLDHPEALRVAGVDEAAVGVGAAVLLVHGEPADAVVAPVVGAVEGVDRQQLDEVDAEVDEVVEPLDRRSRGCRPG